MNPVQHVIIDGNNVMFAYGRLIGPMPGRESFARRVRAWSERHDVVVTIIFDGAEPVPGVRKQMEGGRVTVKFGGARSADDLIQDLIEEGTSPTSTLVVSSDGAIRSAARRRRIQSSSADKFVMRLAQGDEARSASTHEATDDDPDSRPAKNDALDTDEWLREFGLDES